MTNGNYEIEYDDEDGPSQVNHNAPSRGRVSRLHEKHDQYAAPYHYPPAYSYPYRERFRFPAILNTIFTAVLVLVGVFVMERYAPYEMKLSTITGGYEAGVETQVKAAELNEQARFSEYEGQVRVAVETQTKQNEMMLQAYLQNYQQVYDRGKIMAEAAAKMQSQYLEARMAQQNAIQSADTGIISMATLVGRGMNLLQPGAGDQALEYAEDLSAGIVAGLEQAAKDGTQVDLTQWDLGLVPPEQVRAQIASVKPLAIPPAPHLARHVDAPASAKGGR